MRCLRSVLAGNLNTDQPERPRMAFCYGKISPLICNCILQRSYDVVVYFSSDETISPTYESLRIAMVSPSATADSSLSPPLIFTAAVENLGSGNNRRKPRTTTSSSTALLPERSCQSPSERTRCSSSPASNALAHLVREFRIRNGQVPDSVAFEMVDETLWHVTRDEDMSKAKVDGQLLNKTSLYFRDFVSDGGSRLVDIAEYLRQNTVSERLRGLQVALRSVQAHAARFGIKESRQTIRARLKKCAEYSEIDESQRHGEEMAPKQRCTKPCSSREHTETLVHLSRSYE